MAKLTPIKSSLIADCVDLINANLGELLRASTVTCSDCRGRGVIGGEERPDGTVFDDGTLATCATCGGVGAVERYEVDLEKIQRERYGRLVEGFDVKQGVVVPKFRSKDKAFAVLVKLLGYDKAVIEIEQGAGLAPTMTDDERARYREQLAELFTQGLV